MPDIPRAPRRAPRQDGAGRRAVNALAGAVLLLAAGTAPALAEPVRLLALGDSLTAGYGLPPEEGFTAQLESALRARGYDVTVLNGGVSGDTTAGGLARLDWALADGPDAVLVELGSNDMLRGIDPAEARSNLDAILARLSDRGLPTLVAGMYAAPNLGDTYGTAFNAIYPDLAEAYGAALYPFFLDGVALDPALNQGDGMHPNAEGVARVVERILPAVSALVEQAGAAPAGDQG